ncbi:MAG: hypothetical protein HYS81_04950 [Candidatus Aenigmatarchaeota archaeon]|nr:MAG: hypothetical protein HYS81_04950 [Candidatus Aenigmarchaeota archaeon]
MRVVCLLLALVVLVSGCLASLDPYCRSLANELSEEGRACKCVGIDEVKTGADVKPLCRCTCDVGGNITTVDIARTTNPS